MEEDEETPTDRFVSRVRALLEEIPDDLSEKNPTDHHLWTAAFN